MEKLTVTYRIEFIDELKQFRFEQYIKPVANIKDVAEEDVERVTARNTREFYGL